MKNKKVIHSIYEMYLPGEKVPYYGIVIAFTNQGISTGIKRAVAKGSIFPVTSCKDQYYVYCEKIL